MDCQTVITSIVIPLCSALIGGGLTLLGVYLTLWKQSKKDAEIKKLSVKPWIFSFENQTVPSAEKKQYTMVSDYSYSMNAFVAGNIKNTDNGMLILDYVKSEKFIYKPDSGNIVDKDTVIELVIYLKDEAETLSDLNLYVKDIYGNQYQYELVRHGTRFTLGECKEV